MFKAQQTPPNKTRTLNFSKQEEVEQTRNLNLEKSKTASSVGWNVGMKKKELVLDELDKDESEAAWIEARAALLIKSARSSKEEKGKEGFRKMSDEKGYFLKEEVKAEREIEMRKEEDSVVREMVEYLRKKRKDWTKQHRTWSKNTDLHSHSTYTLSHLSHSPHKGFWTTPPSHSHNPSAHLQSQFPHGPSAPMLNHWFTTLIHQSIYANNQLYLIELFTYFIYFLSIKKHTHNSPPSNPQIHLIDISDGVLFCHLLNLLNTPTITLVNNICTKCNTQLDKIKNLNKYLDACRLQSIPFIPFLESLE